MYFSFMPKEAEDLALSITLSNGTVNMGTLKSVCSSWFGLISRDEYEHTHLRLWIMSMRELKRFEKIKSSKEHLY